MSDAQPFIYLFLGAVPRHPNESDNKNQKCDS